MFTLTDGPPLSAKVTDLADGDPESQTATHYGLQWGAKLGYMQWIRENPDARAVNLGRQLGWPDLIRRIRAEAMNREVLVYDAGCGFGSLFHELFAHPRPEGLRYLGADIQRSLEDIEEPEGVDRDAAAFIRWDISDPPPVRDAFDFVICRAVAHHTPDPERTVRALAAAAKPGGRVALAVYAEKTPMREASDTALRDAIVPLPNDEAWEVARQFAVLGRDLRAVGAQVEITENLPFLGIRAGRYDLQMFIYDHLLKCWYNERYGVEHSTVVNFDWYHPQYAYRYTIGAAAALLEQAGLTECARQSNTYQHYLEGQRAG